MNEARITELMENEEFCAGMKKVQSIDEAAEYLASYGVEVTADEIELAKNAAEGELNEEMLDSISGGFCFAGLCIAAFGLGGLVSQCGKIVKMFK